MVFKKKGTEEVVEFQNPADEVKKESKVKEESEEESNISVSDILISHENRLREIEATLYRLKSI